MITDATLPALDLTRDLKELVHLAVVPPGERGDLVRRGLEWLARVVPYDLATYFELEGETLVARTARGPLAGPEVRGHTLALADFPTIREALETRRARAYLEVDHREGDGDPFDGVLDLPPGHACMVVPLCAGDRCRGLLSLDRTECAPYPPETVRLAEVYGQLLAIALRVAEEREAVERFHRQDHVHAKRLEAERAGAGRALFEDSRAPAVQEALRRARAAADADAPVLLRGERGTGKERLARVIHAWSRRADLPFVAVSCPALAARAETDEAGAAVLLGGGGLPGCLAMANGGILFLDDVDRLPPPLQALMVTVLRDGAFVPAGTERAVRVDLRVIAATAADLAAEVAAGRFSRELLDRLDVVSLELPPLRARREDLPALVERLLAEQARRTGRPAPRVDPAALARLSRYGWPGNLRELELVLERAALLAGGEVLRVGHLALPSAAPETETAAPVGTATTLAAVQRAHIEAVLARTGGRIYGPGGAAALLGLKPTTLQSRMKKLGVGRPA